MFILHFLFCAKLSVDVDQHPVRVLEAAPARVRPVDRAVLVPVDLDPVPKHPPGPVRLRRLRLPSVLNVRNDLLRPHHPRRVATVVRPVWQIDDDLVPSVDHVAEAVDVPRSGRVVIELRRLVVAADLRSM